MERMNKLPLTRAHLNADRWTNVRCGDIILVSSYGKELETICIEIMTYFAQEKYSVNKIYE